MRRFLQNLARWHDRDAGVSRSSGSLSSHALPNITIPGLDGQSFSYSLPPTRNPDEDSVLQFSIPKCGTVMSTGIVSRLAKAQGIKFVALESELRFRSERTLPKEARSLFLPKGYCYGNLTSLPSTFDIPIMPDCRSMLIVRDPRDMLVSLYYSMKYSHPEPKEASSSTLRSEFEAGREHARLSDIDSYVSVSIDMTRARFSNYIPVLQMPTLKLFRYEDVIYRKREWVDEICEHFRWNVSRSKRHGIADEFDVFPEQEEQTSHVRQVHPGNYAKHLQNATIRKLESELAEVMRVFGYRPDRSSPSASEAGGVS